MHEEIVKVVQIISGLEKKVQTMTEDQRNLAEEVDKTIQKTNNIILDVNGKKIRKVKAI